MTGFARCLLLSAVAMFVVAGCAQKETIPAAKPVVKSTPSVKPAATPVIKPAPPAVKTDGKGLELIAVKNARVFLDGNEVDMNGGGCHRLRTCDLTSGSGEVSVLDFDRAALKVFLEKNKGKTIGARFVIFVREVQAGPVKVELAALDTTSDWIQGSKDQKQADKGEVCGSAAAFGVKPWTSVDGKPAKNLGDLVYDRKAGKVKTVGNPSSASAAETDKDKAVSVDLDAKFVEHLATDANCKGLVVFTCSKGAKLSFSSRDKENKEPRLVVSAK